MKGLSFIMVLAFVLAISSFGFICGDDEEEDKSPQARVDSWSTMCTLTTVSYGSTTWSNLTFDNTPSEYKNIPVSSERIIIYSGGATSYSPYLNPPEKNHRYTAQVDDKGVCTSFTVTLIDDGTY